MLQRELLGTAELSELEVDRLAELDTGFYVEDRLASLMKIVGILQDPRAMVDSIIRTPLLLLGARPTCRNESLPGEGAPWATTGRPRVRGFGAGRLAGSRGVRRSDQELERMCRRFASLFSDGQSPDPRMRRARPTSAHLPSERPPCLEALARSNPIT